MCSCLWGISNWFTRFACMCGCPEWSKISRKSFRYIRFAVVPGCCAHARTGVTRYPLLLPPGVQVELTAAINPEAAAKVLQALPGQGRQLIAAGDRSARVLAAFMEALDYTIKEELDSSGTARPLREQRLFERDMQTREELQQLETGDWDDKLRKRGKPGKE